MPDALLRLGACVLVPQILPPGFSLFGVAFGRMAFGLLFNRIRRQYRRGNAAVASDST